VRANERAVTLAHLVGPDLVANDGANAVADRADRVTVDVTDNCAARQPDLVYAYCHTDDVCADCHAE